MTISRATGYSTQMRVYGIFSAIIASNGSDHAMTSSNNNLFGTRLRQARRGQHLSMEEFAMRVGAHPETIRKIEAGTRKPSPQVAELIGRALNVPEQDMPVLLKRAR